jgi:anti-sigma B factor antagonist
LRIADCGFLPLLEIRNPQSAIRNRSTEEDVGLKVSTRKVANVVIIDIKGDIALGKHSGELRDTVRELLLDGHKRILLNMEEVNYVDSSGLAELVSSMTSAGSRGGALKLLRIQKKVKESMRHTRIDSVFQIFNDESDALRSFEG